MSRIKPAEVRFYVDADLLGLGHVIAALRPDVTYPGDPGAVIHKRNRAPCPITSPAVKDSEWIPEVARRGGVSASEVCLRPTGTATVAVRWLTLTAKGAASLGS